MISLALEVGIKAVMQGHMYQLDGKVHLQSEGGSIDGNGQWSRDTSLSSLSSASETSHQTFYGIGISGS